MAHKIMTREQARALGRKFYYTGIACQDCYSMGMWHTDTGECSRCKKVRVKREWQQKYGQRRHEKIDVKCPCGGWTSCVTSRALVDGSRRSYQQCTECQQIWICRDGVIEGKSTIGEVRPDDKRRTGGAKPKPTIPGARVILGRCMSGSD